MDNTQTVIEICAGYGGIGLGLQMATGNIKPVCYVEIEAFAIANLVAKMETGQLVAAPIWTDIKSFAGKRFRGKVDIVTAGYPCQPFSEAGQRRGFDDDRHLWPFIRQSIRDIQPRIVFMENVEGHVSLGLSTVLSDLVDDGFTTTWGLFSASEVGAPHIRSRVFILADASIARLQGCEQRGTYGKGSATHGAIAECGNSWPSRPGEHQHEWEPPRVVHAVSKRHRPNVQNGNSASENSRRKESANRIELSSGQKRRQTESAMGGNTNGLVDRLVRSTNRIDEIRLLGNGVVPAQAAKAYITLSERLNNGTFTETDKA